MKVVCIKNRDDGGSIPWTREGHYYKLEIGKIYEGDFIKNTRGNWIYIKDLNYKFSTTWWFVTLEEYREIQLNKIL